MKPASEMTEEEILAELQQLQGNAASNFGSVSASKPSAGPPVLARSMKPPSKMTEEEIQAELQADYDRGPERAFTDATRGFAADVIGFPGTMADIAVGASKDVVQLVTGERPEYTREDVPVARLFPSGQEVRESLRESGQISNVEFSERSPSGQAVNAVTQGALIGGSILGGQIANVGRQALMRVLGRKAPGELAEEGLMAQGGAIADEARQQTQRRFQRQQTRRMGEDAPSGGIVEEIGDAVGTRPGSFAAMEGSGIGASALAEGAYVAESEEDDPFVRFLFGAGGGLAGAFSPTAIAANRGPNAANSLIRWAKSNFNEGAKDEVSRVLTGVAREFEEDPLALARQLEMPTEGISPENLTSATKTNSKMLTAMENRIAGLNPDFARRVQARREGAFKEVEDYVAQLQASGQPEALRLAAAIRKTQFDDAINARVQTAVDNARGSAAAIEGSSSVADTGRRTQQLLNKAYDDISAEEAKYWSLVPEDVRIQSGQMNEAYQDGLRRAQTYLLDDESLALSPELKRSLDAAVKNGVNSGQLKKIRSRLSDRVVELRNQDKKQEAAAVREMSQAMTQLFDKVPGAETARAFSRSKYEAFDDTFAGTAIQREGGGDFRVPAEQVTDKAFAGGRETGDIRFREIEEAGSYVDSVIKTTNYAKQLNREQEEFLRANFTPGGKNDVFNSDGTVNPTKLRRVVDRNQDTLARFPGLQEELQDAERAAVLLNNVNGSVKKAQRRTTAISQVLGDESPVTGVSRIINGPNRSDRLTALANTAKKSGPDAVDGLRSTVMEAVYKNTNGDLAQTRDALFSAPSGGRSLVEVMRSSGVVTDQQAKNLKLLLDQGAQIQSQAGENIPIDQIFDDPDRAFDLMVRVLSVFGASKSPIQAKGPGSLVQAGAASSFGQEFFEKMPIRRFSQVLTEAMENPQMMADLMRRTPENPKMAVENLRRAFDGLAQSGVILAGEARGSQQEESP